MKAVFWIAVLIVGLIAYSATRAVPPDGGASLSSSVSLNSAEGNRAAAAIRARGFHCPAVLTGRRVEIDHRGTKHYRLSCGHQGPDYRLMVFSDGRQSVSPW